MNYLRNNGISAAMLKWIAVATMLIDHFAIAIYWQMDNHTYEIYKLMRYIGRLAFPIYCFLLVEGFFYTKNISRYIYRCFLFAIISEIPFDLAIYGKVFYWQAQNVYFTLVIGLIAIFFLKKAKGNDVFHIILQILMVVVFATMAEFLEVDYHWKGILFIVMFYYCKYLDRFTRNIIGVVTFSYEITAPLAFIPINFYNGKRGKQLKYLFYIIYPLHLLIYGIIRWVMTH